MVTQRTPLYSIRFPARMSQVCQGLHLKLPASYLSLFCSLYIPHRFHRLHRSTTLILNMEPSNAIQDIAKQWKSLQATENTKQQLFEQLYKQLENTIIENKTLKLKIETSTYNEQSYKTLLYQAVRQNAYATKAALTSLQDSSPFVLALVDGDSTLVGTSSLSTY